MFWGHGGGLKEPRCQRSCFDSVKCRRFLMGHARDIFPGSNSPRDFIHPGIYLFPGFLFISRILFTENLFPFVDAEVGAERAGAHCRRPALPPTLLIDLDLSLKFKAAGHASPLFWGWPAALRILGRGLVTPRATLCWHEACHRFCGDDCLFL